MQPLERLVWCISIAWVLSLQPATAQTVGNDCKDVAEQLAQDHELRHVAPMMFSTAQFAKGDENCNYLLRIASYTDADTLPDIGNACSPHKASEADIASVFLHPCDLVHSSMGLPAGNTASLSLHEKITSSTTSNEVTALAMIARAVVSSMLNNDYAASSGVVVAQNQTTGPASRSDIALAPVGAELRPRLDQSHIGQHVSFSPDGRSVLTGEKDLQEWDVRSGRLIRTLRISAHLVDNNVGTMSLDVSPDGKLVATGHWSQANIWNRDTGEPVRRWSYAAEGTSTVQFSRDGRQLLVGAYGTGALFNLKSGKALLTVGTQAFAYLGDLSPDGSLAAITEQVDQRHEVHIYSTRSGREVSKISGDERTSYWHLKFSPDSRSIVICEEEALKVLDVATGKVAHQFFDLGKASSVQFTPSGRMIVSNKATGVQSIDIGSGAVAWSDPDIGHGGELAVSPDGKRVIVSDTAAREKYALKLLDAETGEVLATYFTVGEQGVALRADGLYVTDADPREAFSLKLGGQSLPLNDFIRMNRRETLELR